MKIRFSLLLILMLATFGLTQAQPVTYLWSNGATTPEIVVNPGQTTTYYVTITQDGQQYVDSLVVVVDSVAELFAADTLQGCGSSFSLSVPEGLWQTLEWSNGQSGSSIQVDSSGWYYLDATDTSGCTIRDSVFISLFQVDLGADTAICAGQNVTLNVRVQGVSGFQNLPSGFSILTEFQGKRYLLFNQMINWVDAKSKGDSLGISMYIINSSEEENVVYQSLPIIGAEEVHYWLGLFQDVNDPQFSENSGGWKWVDGTYLNQDSSNWADGEPNNSASNGTSEEFAQIEWASFGMKWNDAGIGDPNNPSGFSKPIYEQSLSSNDNKTFLWSTGETTPSINVSPSQTTTYYCTVTSGGQSCTDSLTLTVNQAPQIPVISADGPTSFCEGGSVTLSVPAGLNYLWSNGQTGQSISVNSTGSYTVQTISSNCTSAVSQVTQVTVNQAPPIPVITAGGPTSFCEGGTVALSAAAGLNYLWSNGQTGESIIVDTTGSYTVQTISSNCTSAVSEPVQVNTSPQPSQLNIGSEPDAIVDSIRLTASGAEFYKWFIDSRLNTPLPLSQSTFLVPCWPPPGRWYYLKGWNDNNEACHEFDSVLVICTPVSAGIQSGSGIFAQPNPGRGLYELSIEKLRGTAKLEVLDALGRLVYCGEVSSKGPETNQQLDIRAVAPGIYTLRLHTIDGPKFLRLKKE